MIAGYSYVLFSHFLEIIPKKTKVDNIINNKHIIINIIFQILKVII